MASHLSPRRSRADAFCWVRPQPIRPPRRFVLCGSGWPTHQVDVLCRVTDPQTPGPIPEIPFATKNCELVSPGWAVDLYTLCSAVMRAFSSVGRALPLQGRCRGFESLNAHMIGARFPCRRRLGPTRSVSISVCKGQGLITFDRCYAV